MAIPLKEMRALDADALRQMIDEIERDLAATWAVYADYCYDNMTWKIIKVVPWAERDLTKGAPGFHKVAATDELDAYKKFMEQMNEPGR